MSRAAFGLLWLLVFTIPWENAIVLPGTGTVTRVLGAAALGAGIFQAIIRGRVRPPGWFLLAVTLFVAWAGVTLFWSMDPEESRRRVQTYVQLAVMAWLIWELADSDERQTSLMQAYILGCWCIAGATIWSYVTGAAGLESRYTAAEGFNENDVALTLVLGIPMAWYLAVTRPGWVSRWFDRAYVPVSLIALLLTASRGGLIAALVGLTIIPLSIGRLDWRSKLVLSLIVVASAWAIATVIPPTSWQRLATTQSELSSGSIGFRKIIWIAGLNVAFAHPAFGVGAGAFSTSVAPELARPFAAHNAFLAVLVEQGVVGLALFAMVFIAAFVAASRLPPMTARFRLVLLATLVIGVMPLNWDYIKTLWFVLALLAAQSAVVDRTRRRYKPRSSHTVFPSLGAELPEVVGAAAVSGDDAT